MPVLLWHTLFRGNALRCREGLALGDRWQDSCHSDAPIIVGSIAGGQPGDEAAY